MLVFYGGETSLMLMLRSSLCPIATHVAGRRHLSETNTFWHGKYDVRRLFVVNRATCRALGTRPNRGGTRLPIVA